jgi:hypothetical protein
MARVDTITTPCERRYAGSDSFPDRVARREARKRRAAEAVARAGGVDRFHLQARDVLALVAVADDDAVGAELEKNRLRAQAVRPIEIRFGFLAAAQRPGVLQARKEIVRHRGGGADHRPRARLDRLRPGEEAVVA